MVKMNEQAAFIMPAKLNGGEWELCHLMRTVAAIQQQTDTNWLLIIVDDFSDNEKVSAALDEIEARLKEKVHIIRLRKNVGTGAARNIAVSYANGIGAPFVLYNDSDDMPHPRWLETVRRKFAEDEKANVVYSSFDVIDENDAPVPWENICMPVREILMGHRKDVSEGENAWVSIAAKKNYTNLTSCTAVRTWLAAEEPFPAQTISEDTHAWFRYGAHPGKFVYVGDIKNRYRICSGRESRSRSQNADFYKIKTSVDQDGFEKAVMLALHFGTVAREEVPQIRLAFYVRLALSILYGGYEEGAAELIASACRISKDKTLECIALLDCDTVYKNKLKEMMSFRQLRGDNSE